MRLDGAVGFLLTVPSTPSPEGRLAAAAAHDLDLGEVDRTLAAVARDRQIEQLARVVHHYLSRLDPDGPQPDPRTVEPHVVVTVSRADLLDVATEPSAATTGFGSPESGAGAGARAETGGAGRLGLVRYNTAEGVERVLEAVAGLVRGH